MASEKLPRASAVSGIQGFAGSLARGLPSLPGNLPQRGDPHLIWPHPVRSCLPLILPAIAQPLGPPRSDLIFHFVTVK